MTNYADHGDVKLAINRRDPVSITTDVNIANTLSGGATMSVVQRSGIIVVVAHDGHG